MELKTKNDVWNFFDNIKDEGYAECRLCKQRLKNDRSYVLKRHLLKVHSTKSDVMKYFKDIDGKGVAECIECKQLVWRNRSNRLERHAEKYHNIKICYFKNPVFFNTVVGSQADVLSGIAEAPTEKVVDNCEKTGEDQSLENENVKRFVESQYDGKCNTKAENILNVVMGEHIIKSAVWGLMIDEGVVPSLFESKNMQSLVKPVCDAISTIEDKECKINKEECEKILCFAANQLCKDLSNELHWRLLSLKLDMDFKGPEKTYGVSVSFVHEGRMQKRFLGVVDFENDHQLTGQHIKQVLNKYNIDPNQIIYACWDDTKSKYNRIVSNSEYFKEIQNFENHPVTHFNGMKIERYVGVLAHLCLLDVLKNPEIFQLFSHCRNFVKFISNESNGFIKILKQKELCIPQMDSPWKWGSTYKMMDELREARKILDTQIYSKMALAEDQFDISEDLWIFVDAFCESLGQIQKSINIFYSEEIHFGDCYAQWLKSKIMTGRLRLKHITNKYVNLLTSEALKCLERRTNYFFGTYAFQACLYLDPRFQHTLSSQQNSIAVDFLKNLWNKSQVYNSEIISDFEESDSELMQEELNDEENVLLNEFLCQDLHETTPRTLGVYAKIEQLKLPFKPAHTNILSFWKNRKTTEPELFYLSEICFAIPATQNYNQRRYTHIYKTQPNRKLPQPTMDNLATIRLNPHLVDDVSKWFDTNEENSHVDDN